ncbi:linoleate 9S-lipoxygenase 6-like [Cucurbita pepo subsp. pepo]|uniref:linoleate 9S-lipoxygenase 6-like n=1 Tax=Cucurbita pepo subsp. pepo TaxID=3664 RepID=UPI000C9D5EE6|nr:linoleate 9S-lipoxygenase 6-like [Cucurbita pepo subsp. pepo]XP_023546455.1 linoleate 9S-lipoxygenase 6-like [Cucurbita pepo subsp. pepo]
MLGVEKLLGHVSLTNLCSKDRQNVSFQLISCMNGDPSNGMQGKVGKEHLMEIGGVENEGLIRFDWDEEIGYPGAMLVTNYNHSSKFFLKSITLHIPYWGNIHFNCNSWIQPKNYVHHRIFFLNKAYLPDQTPRVLQKYREDELVKMRGDGKQKRQSWENIYDYDVYNDISNPDSNSTNNRPILGGSREYPYPRRGRTGRPRSRKDDRYETEPFIEDIYVPNDERFSDLKESDFIFHQVKSAYRFMKGKIKATLIENSPKRFDSLEDFFALYRPRSFFRGSKFPLPQVIKGDQFGWRTDEEFAREMLAGANPMIIRRLQEFPPTSKLDPNVYGDQTSKITKEHIINSLDGLTVDQAIAKNKLYILDHHDLVIPYLKRINATSRKTYATRTVLFLKQDGTLKPLAIELSLPHPQGYELGAISRTLLPHQDKVGEALWQLAKAYVSVNDSGHHQLVSHWLNTHAVIEPFVIATNRQLSVLHPIHKLLVPHFRYTMKINSLARANLINADGVVEKTQYPSKYSMEMSSFAYRSWNFTQQALPADLIQRVAIEDSSAPHGLRLLIADYPYAVDGLDIWAAIKTWVLEYCSLYYENDDMIRNDQELQSWWKEVRERGHEDKKDEAWWPRMESFEELINSCTIIIWISSALHAAVNFGQYPYGGFLPNRPSLSKKFLPEEGTFEYLELQSDPEKVFMKTITSELPEVDILNISTIQFLSTHSPDESYLGERSDPYWTFDQEALNAFERFKKRLAEIEIMIAERNQNFTLKNRVGRPMSMAYTLLLPTSKDGITMRGIPNSISI